ncbi:MAG TPA: hypothetical protein PK821_08090, partial [Victivallales bacterium]|nr:hypothetical protein [Victivallales bacterium]
MNFVAKCRQDSFAVGEPCGPEILITCGRDLKSEDLIQFQFPNSWLLISGPSHTRELQSKNPDAAHYVSISATNSPRVVFNIEIVKRHLNHPEGAVRHGRMVNAKIASGSIPDYTPILIKYQNTFAPYVAEAEELWININGKAPEKMPLLKTRSGSHKNFRVLAPSYVSPYE